MITLFFLSAIILFLIGVPMAVTLGVSSIIYILLAGITPEIMVQKLFTGIDVSSLMAIPFFILAGNLMLTGGLAQRILDLANSMIGNRTGGLGMVTILGCMFFAAIAGSSIATAAALGTLMIPAMVNKGYDRNFATAIVGAASPMGVIIPPSITLIIYGSLSGASISKLYQIGIPAGILVGVCLLIAVYFISKKHGYKGTDEPFSMKAFLLAFKRSLWALGTPIILMGGVFSGVFTPTESGVAAVIYAILVGLFIYRELKLKDLWPIFMDSAKTTASIMFIIANASLFAYVMAYERIPNNIVSQFLSLSDNPLIILLIINIILLIFGTFMDTIAILVIVVPLFLPIVTQMGIDITLFGIIVIVNTAIGMVTPPFGGTLLIASSIGKVPLMSAAYRAFPLIMALIVSLGVITYLF
ncbi:TRAP transporter large permease [Bacillus sp. Marseille-P3661]|uniref:TRAP transporter large permease n=1 Tax=Bacillus sp. Marseille-P3661 TaxID=1936234 RepID=UPI000C825C49|nr:TRAP transporter large permease [Bacillus sp. Marseille-P3661]